MIENITPPVVDEDFLALVFDHCKIEAGAEEEAYSDLVEQYVEAAIERVEAMSGRKLFARAMRLTVDRFETAIMLPPSPVIEVTKVEYVTPEGGLQTIDSGDYVLVDRTGNPALYAAHGTQWPKARASRGAVLVDFTAGYGEAMTDIPASLRQAVMQTVADALRFGGNVATAGVSELPESAYRACLSFRREWT